MKIVFSSNQNTFIGVKKYINQKIVVGIDGAVGKYVFTYTV